MAVSNRPVPVASDLDSLMLTGQTTRMAEITLEADVLNTLGRRSRRRLREIQEKCQAILRLDRVRGILQVVGSEAGIRDVRHQLECMRGPRKQLPTSVWTELMRTRTMQSTAWSSVGGLQQATGCRVHVERSRCEVRLFGSAESVARAGELLDRVAMDCAEEEVIWQHGSTMPSAFELQEFAHQFGVTLLPKNDTRVIVLGLRDEVTAAITELRNHADGKNMKPVATIAMPAQTLKTKNPHGSTNSFSPREEGSGESDTNLTETISTMPPSVQGILAKEPLPLEPAEFELAHGQYIGIDRGRYATKQEEIVCQDNSKCPNCGTSNFSTGCGPPTSTAMPMNHLLLSSHMMQGFGQCAGQMQPVMIPGQNPPQISSQMQTVMIPMLASNMVMGTNAVYSLVPMLTSNTVMGMEGCVNMAPAPFWGGAGG